MAKVDARKGMGKGDDQRLIFVSGIWGARMVNCRENNRGDG